MGKLKQPVKKGQIRNILCQTGWQKIPFQRFLESCLRIPDSQNPFPNLEVQGFVLNGPDKKPPGHHSSIPIKKNFMGGFP